MSLQTLFVVSVPPLIVSADAEVFNFKLLLEITVGTVLGTRLINHYTLTKKTFTTVNQKLFFSTY